MNIDKCLYYLHKGISGIGLTIALIIIAAVCIVFSPILIPMAAWEWIESRANKYEMNRDKVARTD